MKPYRAVVFVLLCLIVISSVGGYFYLNQKFSPPPNYLNISGGDGTVPITWEKNDFSPIAALLLPVTFEGVPHQFYMQFDLGSPSTLFYKPALESIHSKYPHHIPDLDNKRRITAQNITLGKLQISSEEFRILEHGSSIDWINPASLNIIGTIGADLVEQKITVIDFEQGLIFFGDSTTLIDSQFKFVNLIFKKRRILLPAEILGKKYDLLYDSGTSAFALITSEDMWKTLSTDGADVIETKAKSSGRTLTTYTTKSDHYVQFSSVELKLNEVTFIRGTSLMQYWMMRLSGMGGMIGNKLFEGRTILIDCRNRRFGIR